MILIALVSGVGMLMVENWKVPRERPYYEDKLAATDLAQEAFNQVKSARMKVREIDPEFDLLETGLLGINTSSVTSVHGVLPSKQTSCNPNFAAVVVDMLKRAGVKRGDVVGVGFSGSFPALNICTLAALQTLEADPVIISSGAASEWGANLPELLWIDMEKLLHKEPNPEAEPDFKVGDTPFEFDGVFNYRSIGVSIGGENDQGENLSPEGMVAIEEGILRCELPIISGATFEEAVDARIEAIEGYAGRRGIKAYINVGGGAVSSGKAIGKKLFDEGLNLRPPVRMPEEVDGVMPRLSKQGVPVIHLVNVVTLAERFGLPVVPQPEFREVVEPGQGAVFKGMDYNKPLVVGVLVVIVASLFGFIRSDVGFRLLQGGHSRKQQGHPEPMV